MQDEFTVAALVGPWLLIEAGFVNPQPDFAAEFCKGNARLLEFLDEDAHEG